MAPVTCGHGLLATRGPGRAAAARGVRKSARLRHDEDHLTGPGAAARWLAEHDLAPRDRTLDARDLRRLVRFRETLRDHLDGADVSGALNEFAATAVDGPRWSPAGPALVSAGGDVDSLIARLLDAMYRAEVTGGSRRLKPCRARECRWLFYDRSPAGNSVWCGMDICGTRHKMRAYRSRH